MEVITCVIPTHPGAGRRVWCSCSPGQTEATLPPECPPLHVRGRLDKGRFIWTFCMSLDGMASVI